MNKQRSISSVGLERGANNAKVLGSTPILTILFSFASTGEVHILKCTSFFLDLLVDYPLVDHRIRLESTLSDNPWISTLDRSRTNVSEPDGIPKSLGETPNESLGACDYSLRNGGSILSY